MASSEFLSKRVKKKSQTGLTTDRYEFLGLDQAEPDLGDPLVGLSSIGANPAPISGNQYVLIAASGNTGKRYWIAASQITGSGLIPGSFTIFNNNIQVGAANSFNKFNFVGSGVTVDSVRADGVKEYQTDKGWAVVAALDEIAKAHNSSVSAIALAWLRSNPQVSTPIASARTVEQLKEIVGVIELSADEISLLSSKSR